MRHAAVAVLALLVVVAGPGAAQTQAGLDRSSLKDFQSADRALNAAYAKLLAAASPAGRTRLRDAQRAWVRFRDADCLAELGPRQGSVYPLLLNQCMTALTRERARELQARLKCREGELGCGGWRR
jgi:uncharacterized protein YecT (DUF1311 family)